MVSSGPARLGLVSTYVYVFAQCRRHARQLIVLTSIPKQVTADWNPPIESIMRTQAKELTGLIGRQGHCMHIAGNHRIIRHIMPAANTQIGA